ncbi:MAG: PEP-CTERM sorting domain-containing protein [Gemmatirosa sp.]|nr:PEP-CTERM sorting domain-containing protein [Gemmatirosa sp.]
MRRLLLLLAAAASPLGAQHAVSASNAFSLLDVDYLGAAVNGSANFNWSQSFSASKTLDWMTGSPKTGVKASTSVSGSFGLTATAQVRGGTLDAYATSNATTQVTRNDKAFYGTDDRVTVRSAGTVGQTTLHSDGLEASAGVWLNGKVDASVKAQACAVGACATKTGSVSLPNQNFELASLNWNGNDQLHIAGQNVPLQYGAGTTTGPLRGAATVFAHVPTLTPATATSAGTGSAKVTQSSALLDAVLNPTKALGVKVGGSGFSVCLSDCHFSVEGYGVDYTLLDALMFGSVGVREVLSVDVRNVTYLDFDHAVRYRTSGNGWTTGTTVMLDQGASVDFDFPALDFGSVLTAGVRYEMVASVRSQTQMTFTASASVEAIDVDTRVGDFGPLIDKTWSLGTVGVTLYDNVFDVSMGMRAGGALTFAALLPNAPPPPPPPPPAPDDPPPPADDPPPPTDDPGPPVVGNDPAPVPVTATPEPATIVLLGAGLLAVAASRRSRRGLSRTGA